MTDDLLPADLALPPGAVAPIPDSDLELVGHGQIPVALPDLGDHDAVEWAMRRLARLMLTITEQRQRRDAWKARVDDWYAETVGPAERQVAYLEAGLKRYGEAQRALNPRQATVRVPSGEVWTRAEKQPRIAIDDELAVLAYVKANIVDDDAIVKITESVRVGELAKVVDVAERDGELLVLYGGEEVPGVHAEPPRTTSGVRPDYGPRALA